jgi:uncharacterized membrane protein
MRKVFIFGFLVGAAVASLLARRKAEAPGVEEHTTEALGGEPAEKAQEALAAARATLERVREKAREAMAQGKQAAREAEQELRRRYEEMAGRK